MERPSRTEDTPEVRRILEGQIREVYGRVVYTHKTHEKCSDILQDRLAGIKLWQIILSALSTGGFISIAFGSGRPGAIVGVVLSTVLLILNAYTKNYDLGEIAQKHKQTATSLWLTREKYLSLLTDVVMGEKPIECLQAERDELLENLYSIYDGAPTTSGKGYQCAQEALKQREDMTFSDEEIDAFLPADLKRANRKNPGAE